MAEAKKITRDLLSDDLIRELDNTLKKDDTIPWDRITEKPKLAHDAWKAPVATPADLPLEGNQDGDVRLTLEEGLVFSWRSDYQMWELIGANDMNVDWTHLQGIPEKFPPQEHTHTEADIVDLDKYSKSEVDDMLSSKAEVDQIHDLISLIDSKVDKVAGKGLSTNDFTNELKEKLEMLSDEAGVDYSEMDQRLQAHENNTGIHISPSERATWNNKADASLVQGHINNSTVHVTQSEKDNWNSKEDALPNRDVLEKIVQSGSETEFDMSQLATKSDIIEAAGGIAIGPTKPTNGEKIWYKVVG